MYNRTIMIGNLTRDIELKYLPSGLAVAKSSIATSYKYKAQDGSQKEEVCFLEFTIFGRIGEVANQYLRKGSKVLLEGRLILEQWTGQDGSTLKECLLLVDPSCAVHCSKINLPSSKTLEPFFKYWFATSAILPKIVNSKKQTSSF